jgi:hypothetical protein
MNMTVLIASAVGMVAPCIVLWAADQRDRLRPQH